MYFEKYLETKDRSVLKLEMNPKTESMLMAI
jgi:hypothetical protein